MNTYYEKIERLAKYYTLIKKRVLQHQSLTLGLFPCAIQGSYGNEAHVRESIYCAAAIWTLSTAYKTVDADQGRARELEQSAVKTMRGILFCWMGQAEKVEKFKNRQAPKNSLHCRFDMLTGKPTRGDDYEHLQLEIVSLFLIYLVQMTSSGLQIVFSLDEVDFVQNLVFYVERCYRTPDYGMWGRGTRNNDGTPELHGSSIGFAKAALESVNGFSLYGDDVISGRSVLFCDVDANARNRSIFELRLPRESDSKNTDAALITVMGYPAFATHKPWLRKKTMEKCKKKLEGHFGFRRFVRDGYRNALEDPNRKFYEAGEVKNFDKVENEWPVFFAFMLITAIFDGDEKAREKYQKALEKVVVKDDVEHGRMLSPEDMADKEVMCTSGEFDASAARLPLFYYVPKNLIDKERAIPGSQPRMSSPCFSLGAQAIFLISQMLEENLLSLDDLDPKRLRLPANVRPRQSHRYASYSTAPPDLRIQIVPIAESVELQKTLKTFGIESQTPLQVNPIIILPQLELVDIFRDLGLNKRLGLGGRPSRPFGVLSTSKIYRVAGREVVSYPITLEAASFYRSLDMNLLLDNIRADLFFIANRWKMVGRPVYIIPLRESHLKGSHLNSLLELFAEMKRGFCRGVSNGSRLSVRQNSFPGAQPSLVDWSGGVPVQLTRLQLALTAASVDHLDFVDIDIELGTLKCLEQIRGDPSIIDLSLNELSMASNPPAKTLRSKELNAARILEDAKKLSTHDILRTLDHDSCSSPHLSSIWAQGVLLSVIYEREGAEFPSCRGKIGDRMLGLIHKAANYGLWTEVRMMSTKMGHLSDSLAPSLTMLLVQGKRVTLGVIPSFFVERNGVLDAFDPKAAAIDEKLGEVFVDSPILPAEIKKILYERCSPFSCTQAVLQQELILGCAQLATLKPHLFDGILTIRMGWILRAMRIQLTQEHARRTNARQELPLLSLNNLSPSDMLHLLERTLAAGAQEIPSATTSISDGKTPLEWRRLRGALNRMPTDIYERVWAILGRAPRGIIICEQLLPSDPTLQEMTLSELSFALTIENLLSKIRHPEYRQLIVELVMVVSTILTRNPELSFSDPVNLDAIVRAAFALFQRDVDERDGDVKEDEVWNRFYSLPPDITCGSSNYLIKTTLEILLKNDICSKDGLCGTQ